MRRLSLSLFVGLLVVWPCLDARPARAQRIEIDRTTDEASETPTTSSDESNDAESDEKEEGESASTGSMPGAEGVPRFDNVTEKRIRPGKLPPPVSNDIPSVLTEGSKQLPKPPSKEQLNETGERVRKRVFEVVAIQSPDVPKTSSTIVHRGHAVWLATDDEARPPVLVTTFFWLSEASEIFIVPPDTDVAPADEGGLPNAERRSLGEITVQPGGDDWLGRHRDDLLEAKLYRPDKHRNLVVVVPESPDAIDLPMPPLTLLDFKRETPVRLYGYSPRVGSGLVQTQIPATHPDHESLTYYLQTSFQAPFGAPIVDAEGRLLALTAFLHPEDADTTLVVPPAPIEAYLDEIQGDGS
jgi:hypothetical protein